MCEATRGSRMREFAEATKKHQERNAETKSGNLPFVRDGKQWPTECCDVEMDGCRVLGRSGREAKSSPAREGNDNGVCNTNGIKYFG
jgi:hypothetical protein